MEAPGTPGGSGQNPVQEVKGQIYAFPNMVPAVAQNDQVTTYLMIEGYYQDGTDNTPENPRNKKTYYRFNMAQNGQSQILRRNHVYRGVIVYASAPGSETETETGAEDATVPQLTYSIGETWEETGNSTVTDANGNFLIVSRAMMTFSSDVGSDETVKVQVKEGLSWAVEWVDESGGGDHGYFEYSRIDDGSFSVRTKGDNKTEFIRRARLKVTASGGSVSPTAPLVAFIDVVQFSSTNDSSVLLVTISPDPSNSPFPARAVRYACMCRPVLKNPCGKSRTWQIALPPLALVGSYWAPTTAHWRSQPLPISVFRNGSSP